MVKRIDAGNVLDMYPEEMQPSTNGHKAEIDETDMPTTAFVKEAEEDVASEQHSEYARIVEELEKPLDRRLIAQREGYGKDKNTGKQKMLNYLEHHVVTRALNRVFGYGRWSSQTLSVQDYFDPKATDGIPRAVRVMAQLHVSAPGFDHYEPMARAGYVAVTPKQVWRDGRKTDEVIYTWAAYEMALGNAEAKAIKRCAAQYGDQFGLSLYEGEEALSEAEKADEGEVAEHRAPRNQPSSEVQREYEDDDAVAECEKCGKEIKGYTNRQGRTYTTQQLVDMSRKQSNGRVLCLDCRHN